MGTGPLHPSHLAAVPMGGIGRAMEQRQPSISAALLCPTGNLTFFYTDTAKTAVSYADSKGYVKIYNLRDLCDQFKAERA